MIFWLIVVIALIGAFFAFIGIYNKLVRAKNQAHNAFSQIDVQLKRRHDLIPNLVNTAKRYLSHEENTLTQITQARNQASLAEQKALETPNASNLQQLSIAENTLSRALGQFYAVVESYPELKADSMIHEVMDELTNTENRIGFARQHYNDSVMAYHNAREVFPNNLICGMFQFPIMGVLKFDDHNAINQAPKVDFS